LKQLRKALTLVLKERLFEFSQKHIKEMLQVRRKHYNWQKNLLVWSLQSSMSQQISQVQQYHQISLLILVSNQPKKQTAGAKCIRERKEDAGH